MNASSRTATGRRTTSNGSSGPQLDVDRIRHLAAEDDDSIPEMTAEQARAIITIILAL